MCNHLDLMVQLFIYVVLNCTLLDLKLLAVSSAVGNVWSAIADVA